MKEIQSFTHYTPTRVEYGKGVVENKLIDEVKSFNPQSILVVADKGVFEAGLVKGIEKQLKENNFKFEVFSDVTPEPPDTLVAEVEKLARKLNIDLFIAVGGGSAMDLAKSVGTLMTNGGKIEDYYFPLETITEQSVPVITIPTTAGTGSEVTFFAVVADTREKTHIKQVIASYLDAPQVALVDPLMTVSLPPRATAATGIDALSHAIEEYISLMAQPLADTIALKAINLITNYLPAAVFNGENIEARDHMMLGSMMAGMAFCNSDVNAVHCLGESLGGMKPIPHGITCAVFLPYVMDYCLMACPDKFVDIARAMGEKVDGLTTFDAAKKSVEAVMRIIKLIDIPSLKDLDFGPADFAQLAEMSFVHTCNCDTPRKMSVEDYKIVIKNAYEEKLIH